MVIWALARCYFFVEVNMEVVIPEHNIGIRIDMSQCLLDLKTSMKSIVQKWTGLSPICIEETDAISLCMMQMMICKLTSFATISGIDNCSESKQNKMMSDIESLSAIARSIYEMAFMYHNMFIMPESDKESKILLLLWKIRGFNNRLYSNDPYQSPEQKKRDKKELGISAVRGGTMNTRFNKRTKYYREGNRTNTTCTG